MYIKILYRNSSVWIDTRDATIWDRNPADITSIRYLITRFVKKKDKKSERLASL